jgi:hypothetical protein
MASTTIRINRGMLDTLRPLAAKEGRPMQEVLAKAV